MPRVTHFNIQAEDPQRAMKFYSQVFDWEFDKFPGAMEYWLITTGNSDEPGIDGGMSYRAMDLSFNSFVNTIEVQDVDACVARIKVKGGKTLSPKIAIAGIGFYVPCQDTEGNTFGILEPDESASW